MLITENVTKYIQPLIQTNSENHPWSGSYYIKPLAQVEWDNRVKWASQDIAASSAETGLNTDIRPRIKDFNSGLHFLIDSGAQYGFSRSQSAHRPRKTNQRAFVRLMAPRFKLMAPEK